MPKLRTRITDLDDTQTRWERDYIYMTPETRSLLFEVAQLRNEAKTRTALPIPRSANQRITLQQQINLWIRTTPEGEAVGFKAAQTAMLRGPMAGLEYMKQEYFKLYPKQKPKLGRPFGIHPKHQLKVEAGRIVAEMLETMHRQLIREAEQDAKDQAEEERRNNSKFGIHARFGQAQVKRPDPQGRGGKRNNSAVPH